MPKLDLFPLNLIFRPKPPDLIVMGLGNPGQEYISTRHNVGFWLVDKMSSEYNIDIKRKHRLVQFGEGAFTGNRIVFAKPRTFVNNSGQAARYLLTRFGIPSQKLMVVYDDMDIPVGKIRIRGHGSPGSHNGARSVFQALMGGEFPRLRLGIGRPHPRSDQIKYVLGQPTKEEKLMIDKALETGAKAIETMLGEGIVSAMNEFNGDSGP
jgi:PTH1 family peptidyl-tRNA hydrolase